MQIKKKSFLTVLGALVLGGVIGFALCSVGDVRQAFSGHKQIQAILFGAPNTNDPEGVIAAQIPTDWNLAYTNANWSTVDNTQDQKLPKDGSQAFSFATNEKNGFQAVAVVPSDVIWTQVDVFAYPPNYPGIAALYPKAVDAYGMTWSKEAIAGYVADVESHTVKDGPTGKTYYLKFPDGAPFGLVIIREHSEGTTLQKAEFVHFLKTLQFSASTQ